MDEVIKVRRSFLNEIRAFCNCLTSFCNGCYHNPCNCGMENEIRIAKQMIVKLDNLRNAREEQYFIANPIEENELRIKKAIIKAGRPVRFGEIYLERTSKQKKNWLLERMIRRGALEITISNGVRYFALPCRNGNTHNNNNTKKGHYGI